MNYKVIGPFSINHKNYVPGSPDVPDTEIRGFAPELIAAKAIVPAPPAPEPAVVEKAKKGE